MMNSGIFAISMFYTSLYFNNQQMRLILRQYKLFSSTKNTSDIIFNYTHITGLDRVKKIAEQSYLSATDYNDGQHYSRLTDLLSFDAVKRMHRKMSKHQTGRRILQQKPRITDQVYRNLQNLQEGTFGKQYFNFMNGLSFIPSERPVVKYIPDLEYAYVLQRYKQIHDFVHVLLSKKISVDQQLLLKWFQMRQLRLPSATLASIISPFLSSNFKLSQISRIINIADRSQFIMNIYFEQHFSEPAEKVRERFGFK